MTSPRASAAAAEGTAAADDDGGDVARDVAPPQSARATRRHGRAAGHDGQATPQDAAIRTEGLTKRFRSGQVAVDQVDLQVPRGAVYGFLGPNGSGKTTTIRMLLGLIGATAGQAWLLGEPMPQRGPAVLPRVGALIEGPAFQPHLSGRANLLRLDACDASAPPDPSRRVTGALERVGLTSAAGKRYRQYSMGMKQRLGLAAALLRPRDLLVLDEPTNGLDPQGTREVRRLIAELAAEGTTVLVSSHLLAEIENVCSHVGIMSAGRLVLQGERAGLTAAAGRLWLRTEPSAVSSATRVLSRLGLAQIEVEGAEVLADLEQVRPEQVTAALVTAGVPVLGLTERAPTLEDVFVRLTGEGFDVDG